MESYNAHVMHAYVQFDQTEANFEPHKEVEMKKTEAFDCILHNFSPDLGCQEDRIHISVPAWNFDLE